MSRADSSGAIYCAPLITTAAYQAFRTTNSRPYAVYTSDCLAADYGSTVRHLSNTMVFFTESWFWRGTQSAIFYYISMSPCLEYRHKKKRREEAVRIKKERDEIVMNQPEIRSHWQPAPFNTNPYWAEEIFRGPVSETYNKKKKRLFAIYTVAAFASPLYIFLKFNQFFKLKTAPFQFRLWVNKYLKIFCPIFFFSV